MHEIGAGEALLCVLIIVYLSYQILPLSAANTATAAIIYYCYSKVKNVNTYWKRQGINGPEPNLLFGNAISMKAGFQKFDIENYAKYGPIYGTTLFGRPDLVVADPDLLKQILVKDFAHFNNRRTQYCVRSSINVINHMLTVMKDERWKNVRSTISPTFSTGKLKKVFPIVRDCVLLMRDIAKDTSKNGGSFDAMRICGNLTMDVIGRTAFGINVQSQGKRESEFIYFCRKALNFTFTDYKLIADALFPNVMSTAEEIMQRTIFDNDCNNFFKEVVKALIKERKYHPIKENPDFLQLILNTRNEGATSHEESDSDNGECQRDISKGKKVHLDDIEIAGQCFLFLIAGYETTASAICFALYLLANNLSIQERAYEEIIDVVGQKELIEYEDISAMKYLEQIMLETLRLYPPAPRFDRECSSDTVVGGIYFEKNCIVSVPVYAIHYDEKNYPDPYKFDPERFSTENKASRNPFTFLPFGFGPRNCLGRRFSIMEFQLTMAYLLRSFRFGLSDKTPKYPLALSTAGMTRSLQPIILQISER